MHSVTHARPLVLVTPTVDDGVSEADARPDPASEPQEHTGRDNSHPVSSWSIPAPSGAYGACAAWTSRGAWLAAIERYFLSGGGDAWRRAHRYSVSAGTLLAVARIDSGAADHGTGRSLSTSNESAAGQLGCSSKTIQRARVMLEDAGFYVTVAEGRYLTQRERVAARKAHGHSQVRAASTRALTLPKWAAVQNVHLPGVARVNPPSSVSKSPKSRADARDNAAARRAAKTGRPSQGRRRGRRTFQPASPELLLFAAQLAQRFPWLRHVHRQSVCAVIRRTGWDVTRCDVDDLVALADQRNQAAGRDALTVDQVRHPLGFLFQQITAAAEFAARTGYVPRAERYRATEAERAQRLAQQARERQETAELRARLDSPEETAAREAILAAMRAQFPRTPSRRRR